MKLNLKKLNQLFKSQERILGDSEELFMLNVYILCLLPWNWVSLHLYTEMDSHFFFNVLLTTEKVCELFLMDSNSGFV